MIASLLTEIPIVIDRDDARRAAQAELTDPVYQSAKPSVLSQLLEWFSARLGELFRGAASVLPGGPLGLIVLGLAAIALIVAVRLRVGKVARGARRGSVVFEGRARTAGEHRRAAGDAAHRGDLAEAVRERFRAVVRDLEQRGVLDERPGRTADEAAVDAGRRLPACAGQLRAAAAVFDEVHYGGHTATRKGYERLVALDAAVAGERPVPVGAP